MLSSEKNKEINLILLLFVTIIILIIYEYYQGQFSKFSRYEKQDVIFYGFLSSLIAYIVFRIINMFL